MPELMLLYRAAFFTDFSDPLCCTSHSNFHRLYCTQVNKDSRSEKITKRRTRQKEKTKRKKQETERGSKKKGGFEWTTRYTNV